jgi:hypothetical protein
MLHIVLRATPAAVFEDLAQDRHRLACRDLAEPSHGIVADSLDEAKERSGAAWIAG